MRGEKEHLRMVKLPQSWGEHETWPTQSLTLSPSQVVLGLHRKMCRKMVKMVKEKMVKEKPDSLSSA